MANILRRFAEKARSKSRSKSPTKRVLYTQIIRTQYVDENAERFHPQSISAYSTWQTVGLHDFGSSLAPNGWTGHQHSLLPPLSAHTSSTEFVNASHMNTLNPPSRGESVNGFRASNSRLAPVDGEFPDQIDFGGSRLTLPRLRSESPQKSPREIRGEHRPRSRSPKKPSVGSQTPLVRHTFDYTHAQCRIEGCSAAIVVDESRFLVCKHQLAHVCRNIQFQWFVECIVPGPILRDITDEVLETCMRLSKRFAAKGLEVRCAKFIREHQTANVFHTIHKMDHFHVEVEKCPRCSRQKEQGRVRILANPCQKLIGCDRCLKDLGCEIERRADGDFQAFYQCEHGLLPFGEETEDCACQGKLYTRRRVENVSLTTTNPSDSHVDFDGEPT
ncbi:Protein Y69H25 [Aphelenchoides fujianensis]|nr:Protein Y69H25 [Aphelenchoides fujianensis]